MAEASCERNREDLEALHYGDLEGEERAGVEAHVASCAACRAALEAVRETAAQLDGLAVPEPSELDWARFGARLEARVAPIRAARMATTVTRWARYARVAAAVLIGGLLALAAGLFVETREQEKRIDTLTKALADASWESGDMHRFIGLVRAPQFQADPTVRKRLEALEAVEDPEVARAWALARQKVGEDEQRQAIADFVAAYPKHPLADQALIASQKTGVPTPPPLEQSALRPIPLVPQRATPGETPEATYRLEIAKHRAHAAKAGPKLGAFALFRAGQIAEEKLRDFAEAERLYGEAMRLVPSGPLHEAAKEGLARITPR